MYFIIKKKVYYYKLKLLKYLILMKLVINLYKGCIH